MACESLIQAKKIAVQKGLSADSVTCPQDPKYIENTKQP